MNKIFYFDLEETLISSFNNPVLVNENAVEDYILANDIKEISIFSAAISDTRDKGRFIEKIQPLILERYDITIPFNKIIMLQEVVDSFMENMGVSLDVAEMLCFYGKDGSFHKYCKFVHEKDTHCILLDDSYENQSFISKDRNSVSEIVNINSF